MGTWGSGGGGDRVTIHPLQLFPTELRSPDTTLTLPNWTELVAAVPIRYLGETEIFGEGEPVDYLYKVVEGAVRTFKVLEDGRRQVTSFYLSGEFFGVEAAAQHAVSAEAVTAVKLLLFKRSVLEVLAQKEIQVTQLLWHLTASELMRTQDHASLLIKSARERVANFLIGLANRQQSERHVYLPMSRQDIADYLGLTIETVSRIVGELEAKNTIARTTSRRLRFNRAKLDRAAFSI